MGFWDTAKKIGGYALDPLNISGLNPDNNLQTAFDRTKSGAAAQFQSTDRGNFNLPGYDQLKQQYGDYLGRVDSRTAPQLGNQSEFRDQQRELARGMFAAASGQGPSVAEQQMRQGLNAANAQARSMMAGASPSNAALAMRLGSQAMGRNAMGIAGQAGMARLQEQQMARNALGSLLGQARGQDDQRQLAQAQITQQQTAMDDAARQGLLGGSLSASEAQQRGGMGYEQVQASKYGAALGVPTGGEVVAGMATGLIPALASDKRMKTNVAPGGQAADQFLDSVKPQQFEYANAGWNPPKQSSGPYTVDVGPAVVEGPGAPAYQRKTAGAIMMRPPGENLGVMAQDVKDSPAGNAVQQGQDGFLGINTTAITGPILAGLGRLNERLQALETSKAAPAPNTSGKARSGYGRIGR